MLDAFIIDAIRREEAERVRAQENRITLEVPDFYPMDRPQERAPESEDRGPIVIPLYPDEDEAEDAA